MADAAESESLDRGVRSPHCEGMAADAGEPDSLAQGVRNTFNEHHSEIRRRASLETGRTDTSSFGRTQSGSACDFAEKETTHMLFSLSTVEFAPISVDPQNPGLRIYGGFSSREEALAHAARVQAIDQDSSLFADETHRWIVASSCPERMGDVECVGAQRDRLLRSHADSLQKNQREFEANVSEQKTGEVVFRNAEGTESEVGGPPKGKRFGHRLPAGAEVRGQRFAVVSFVRDDEAAAEFLFRVYAFVETEQEADDYVRNVCGERVSDFDIDVVSTCEWVFPQSMRGEKARKEVYRVDELDKIMSKHKSQPAEVARYREWRGNDPSSGSESEVGTSPAGGEDAPAALCGVQDAEPEREA